MLNSLAKVVRTNERTGRKNSCWAYLNLNIDGKRLWDFLNLQERSAYDVKEFELPKSSRMETGNLADRIKFWQGGMVFIEFFEN